MRHGRLTAENREALSWMWLMPSRYASPCCGWYDFFHHFNDICFQARIAEEAGACAVMALERVPADIRKEGGVARMVRV
jgi:SOR/SNZ family